MTPQQAEAIVEKIKQEAIKSYYKDSSDKSAEFESSYVLGWLTSSFVRVLQKSKLKEKDIL
jgi:hypothetical protein